MFCPIALQLYSVRNELQKDFPGTLAQVKEMGYDGVELAGLCGYSPEQVKKMCEEAGLVPISAHVPLAEMSADPEKTMKDYAGMDAAISLSPTSPRNSVRVQKVMIALKKKPAASENSPTLTA